jgi:hypothetical protein
MTIEAIECCWKVDKWKWERLGRGVVIHCGTTSCQRVLSLSLSHSGILAESTVYAHLVVRNENWISIKWKRGEVGRIEGRTTVYAMCRVPFSGYVGRQTNVHQAWSNMPYFSIYNAHTPTFFLLTPLCLLLFLVYSSD